MGGHGSFLTLHEIMAAYRAERRTKPDMTPHDFIVESSETISFQVASEPDRAQRRQERERAAEVAAFIDRLPPGHGIRVGVMVRGERPIGHVGTGQPHPHMSRGWEVAVCGAPCAPLKRPEHETVYPICETCRGLMSGVPDGDLAPAMAP